MPDTPARPNPALAAINPVWWLCGVLSLVSAMAQAAEPRHSPSDKSLTTSPVVQNSNMDAALFYQLLRAELEMTGGDAGIAYQIYLDAAKHNQGSQQANQLYQRAVEIALRAHAGEQALAAAKSWRQALPQSREASEYTAQILIAMGRTADLAAPLRTMIQLSPSAQQSQVILGLPRTLARLPDHQATAQVIDDATQPWRQSPLELPEAWAVSSEGWLQANNTDKAMAAAYKASTIKPDLPVVGLLAIELMSSHPEAEQIVKTQLAMAQAQPLVRLAYARKLAGIQRLDESAAQLETLLKAKPDQMGSWLTLAAVRLELKQPDKAEQALKPVLALENKPMQKGKAKITEADSLIDTDGADDAPTKSGQEDGGNDLQQAYMLMAQAEEQRQHNNQALKWLDKADPQHTRLGVQTQRAHMLLRLGKLEEARAALRGLPETEPRDVAIKLQVEAQLLRDAKQYKEAYQLLHDAAKRFPSDADLLYDQAMMADRLKQFDDMESILRKVVALSPDNANAYNALGYSLADRGVRLDEARKLITKAQELRPGDPFITDSQGWLAFRAGQAAEATRLLKLAYQMRPDPEIGAHLGEVLWVQGKQDEARQLLRSALQREKDNEALLDTVKRLNINP